MPDITLEDLVRLDDLVRMDACGPARDAFAAQFPDGASCRELLLALVKHPCGIEWWRWLALRSPALRPAWDAYMAEDKLLWAAYTADARALLDAYMEGRKTILRDVADRVFPAKEA